MEGKIIKFQDYHKNKENKETESPINKVFGHLAQKTGSSPYLEEEKEVFLIPSHEKRIVMEKYNKIKKFFLHKKNDNYITFYNSLKDEDIKDLVSKVVKLQIKELEKRPAYSNALFNLIFEKEKEHENKNKNKD